MKTYPKVPVSWWRLVTYTYSCYWQVFRKAWPLSLLSGALIAIYFLIKTTNSGISIFISLIIMILGVNFLIVSLIHLSDSILSNQISSLKASLKFGKSRFLPLLGANILLFIILICFVSIIAIPLVLIHSEPQTNAFLLVGIFLIETLLSLLFIYLFYSFFAIPPSIVLTQRGIFASFKYSFNLTKGNWWRVFGSYLLLIIIANLIMFAVGLILGFLFSVISELTLDVMYGVARAHQINTDIGLRAITYLISALLIFPLHISYLLILFHDLRLRKPNVV